jgi:hypothetical protein
MARNRDIPRDRKGRFAQTNFGAVGKEFVDEYPPPPRRADEPVDTLPPEDWSQVDIYQVLEDHRGPRFADCYQRLISGEWEPPAEGTVLTEEQEFEAHVMSIAAKYEIAKQQNRDPFEVFIGRDIDGFTNDEYAGFDRKGKPTFANRELYERLQRAVNTRRRFFAPNGTAENGSQYDPVLGIDVHDFYPKNEDGVYINFFTGGPFGLPPEPKTREGYRMRDGKRRTDDGKGWERHPEFPRPHWSHCANHDG